MRDLVEVVCGNIRMKANGEEQSVQGLVCIDGARYVFCVMQMHGLERERDLNNDQHGRCVCTPTTAVSEKPWYLAHKEAHPPGTLQGYLAHKKTPTPLGLP